jgi:hypothetical protein
MGLVTEANPLNIENYIFWSCVFARWICFKVTCADECKRFALQVFDFQRLALQVKRFSQR